MRLSRHTLEHDDFILLQTTQRRREFQFSKKEERYQTCLRDLDSLVESFLRRLDQSLICRMRILKVMFA